jgi:hypothetical protein
VLIHRTEDVLAAVALVLLHRLAVHLEDVLHNVIDPVDDRLDAACIGPRQLVDKHLAEAGRAKLDHPRHEDAEGGELECERVECLGHVVVLVRLVLVQAVEAVAEPSADVLERSDGHHPVHVDHAAVFLRTLLNVVA